MNEIGDELDPPFDVLEPAEARGPVLFNSPHSGSTYPRDFLAVSRLDTATLRRSEDSFVDELIAGVVGHGFPLMRAHFPRCFVDVNREPYELDPRMFDGRLPSFANTRSMRVAGGLGTVARVVGDAQEIYDQRIPVDDALRRIESLYKPYHRALRRLFKQLNRRRPLPLRRSPRRRVPRPRLRSRWPRAAATTGRRSKALCEDGHRPPPHAIRTPLLRSGGLPQIARCARSGGDLKWRDILPMDVPKVPVSP